MTVGKSYGVIYKHQVGLHDIAVRLGKLLPSTLAEQEKHKVHECLIDLRKRSNITIVLNLCGIWAYNLAPLVMQLFGIFFEGKPFEKRLPTHMWLWYDPFEPGIYESMYLFISWLGFTMAVTILATDLLFFSILTLVSMQFKILSRNIREIEVTEDGEHLEEIKTQVKVHQELIDLSAMIEKIYSPSFLMNVMTSSMIICLTGFQAFVIKFNFQIFKLSVEEEKLSGSHRTRLRRLGALFSAADSIAFGDLSLVLLLREANRVDKKFKLLVGFLLCK